MRLANHSLKTFSSCRLEDHESPRPVGIVISRRSDSGMGGAMDLLRNFGGGLGGSDVVLEAGVLTEH